MNHFNPIRNQNYPQFFQNSPFASSFWPLNKGLFLPRLLGPKRLHSKWATLAPKLGLYFTHRNGPVFRCMTFADCRLQTADCRPQTADCRLQTTDCRPQIADCKLKDTKNLPNKGDTIKNITSCESEKIAWEQGWYFCAKLHWPHFQDAAGYSSPTRLFIDSSDISLIALILYSSLIIVNW